MSPAHVTDAQYGPTPTFPFQRYKAYLTCDEHPDYVQSMNADSALLHLSNLQDLEDIAAGHNRTEHGTDTTERRTVYRPATTRNP